MAAVGVATIAGAVTRMHRISDGVRLAYRVLSPSLTTTPVLMIQGLSGVKEVRPWPAVRTYAISGLVLSPILRVLVVGAGLAVAGGVAGSASACGCV